MDSTLQPLQIDNLALAVLNEFSCPHSPVWGWGCCWLWYGRMVQPRTIFIFLFYDIAGSEERYLDDLWWLLSGSDTWHVTYLRLLSSAHCHRKNTRFWWKANKNKTHISNFLITFYASVPYVYKNLWLPNDILLHCIALSCHSVHNDKKNFPIPFHLRMSTSNLRAKQLIGLMVIEDWRYCLLPPTLEVTFVEFESFYIILFVSGPYVDTADPYPPNSQVLQSWVDNVDLSVSVFTFLAEDFNLKIDKKFINILVDLTKARSVGDFTHTSTNPPIQLCLQFTCQLQ